MAVLYRKWTEPSGLHKIEEFAMAMPTKDAVAERIGIKIQTFDNWLIRYAGVELAFKRGCRQAAQGICGQTDITGYEPTKKFVSRPDMLAWCDPVVVMV